MNRHIVYGSACALLIASGLLATPAPAAGFYESAPPSDIEMCVAEIRARADLSDSERVRHAVATTKRTVGYSIEIETTVYGSGSVLREYETVCVATGGERPARFAIHARE